MAKNGTLFFYRISIIIAIQNVENFSRKVFNIILSDSAIRKVKSTFSILLIPDPITT